MRSPIYAEERRQEILALARADGRVHVASLADRFDVTTETIRHDLTQLEDRGVLRRVHGGAIPIERLRSEPAVAERAKVQSKEKARIAELAVDEVPPSGGSIIIDAGTTTNALAERLPTDRELTAITNALPIAMTLTLRPNLTVLLVGGRVRRPTLANVDAWALRTLAEMTVDVAFVATNGITADGGLTTPDLAEAAVKRAAIRAARRVVLLADHTKVGAVQFARFADLDQIDLLITDSGIDSNAVTELRQTGLEVALA